MNIMIAIALTGIGTYACRALFIVALAGARFPPRAMRALEYVAPAVMASLVVSMLTTPAGQLGVGTSEVAGLGLAVLVAATTRNHIYTLLAGMLAFWVVGAIT
jgi:branched-subunit amino acid transport protein